MEKITKAICKMDDQQIKNKFHDYIMNEDYPCVMAQTVLRLDQAAFHVYENFGSQQAAHGIIRDLKTYINGFNFEAVSYFSFIAAFKNQQGFTESEFEQLLWKQLKMLHEADDQPWDSKVNSDPQENNFSFSLSGKAFYIVGLHPNSSRKARQSPCPAIVFNLHAQFEKLRKMGSYQKLRDKIRDRDQSLQGNINPSLEDFGESSEARQYSGKKSPKDWKCPFQFNENSDEKP